MIVVILMIMTIIEILFGKNPGINNKGGWKKSDCSNI